MHTFMVMTGSGPLVVLTNHPSTLDDAVLYLLAKKGIKKFIAYEIPLDLARERYGLHFDMMETDLKQTDALRVLDEDGEHVFRLFRFDELGPPVSHEAGGDDAARDRNATASGVAQFQADVTLLSRRIEDGVSRLKRDGQFQAMQRKTESDLREQERKLRHRVEDAARTGEAFNLLKAELERDRRSLFDNLIRFEQEIDAQFERSELIQGNG